MVNRAAAECPRLRVESASEWRKWLRANHSKSGGVWLVFDRKGTTAQTLDYTGALDEALCFGWIDSLIRNIDGQRYMRKFTPRGAKSKWSPSNKKRIESLTKKGRMSAAGLAVVERAAKDGSWERPDRIPVTDAVPEELVKALRGRPAAGKNFKGLAPSHRTRYIMWIASAKLAETRKKRAAEAASLLEKNEKLGLR